MCGTQATPVTLALPTRRDRKLSVFGSSIGEAPAAPVRPAGGGPRSRPPCRPAPVPSTSRAPGPRCRRWCGRCAARARCGRPADRPLAAPAGPAPRARRGRSARPPSGRTSVLARARSVTVVGSQPVLAMPARTRHVPSPERLGVDQQDLQGRRGERLEDRELGVAARPRPAAGRTAGSSTSAASPNRRARSGRAAGGRTAATRRTSHRDGARRPSGGRPAPAPASAR